MYSGGVTQYLCTSQHFEWRRSQAGSEHPQHHPLPEATYDDCKTASTKSCPTHPPVLSKTERAPTPTNPPRLGTTPFGVQFVRSMRTGNTAPNRHRFHTLLAWLSAQYRCKKAAKLSCSHIVRSRAVRTPSPASTGTSTTIVPTGSVAAGSSLKIRGKVVEGLLWKAGIYASLDTPREECTRDDIGDSLRFVFGYSASIDM